MSQIYCLSCTHKHIFSLILTHTHAHTQYLAIVTSVLWCSLERELTLEGFKSIFFWEYIHRMWGRSIALVFFVPMVYFLKKGYISKSLKPRLVLYGAFLVFQVSLCFLSFETMPEQVVFVYEGRLKELHFLFGRLPILLMEWISLLLSASDLVSVDYCGWQAYDWHSVVVFVDGSTSMW